MYAPTEMVSGAVTPLLDLNAILAPEHAHAINSFRFNKKVPLLGRFQDAAAVCLFYFMLLRVLRSAMKGQKEVRTWQPLVRNAERLPCNV